MALRLPRVCVTLMAKNAVMRMYEKFSTFLRLEALSNNLKDFGLNKGLDNLDQLRRIWLQFDSADRRDPVVASCAARRAAELGAPEEGRAWLRPFWERLGELGPDDRAAVAQGLIPALPGIGPEWLARLEAASQAFPREAAIAQAVGSALAERKLWGKARQLLEVAAEDADLSADQRRRAWLTMARMAEEEGNSERAVQCFEAAARLG